MYVCICHAVTDGEVHRAVDAGARTVEEIAERTAAGRTCATCHDHLEDLVAARCMTCPFAGQQVA